VDLSSGVLVELRTIREHRRQDATLVVLSEDAHAADPLTISMSQVYDTEMKQSPRLDDLRVQLIDFPRVIRADEISFEDLASSPLFPDLLARAAFIQSLTVEQRQARQRAERLLEAVPDLIARNASELALSHLREALSLIRTLGDEWLLRRTHAQLGVVYYLQERFADAIAAFTEALRLARAAGDWAEEGLYLKDLGDCHRAAGAHSDAVQAYLAALEILGETSSDAYVDALRKLGGTYSEAADFERADGRFDQAFQIYEQAGQLSGMMEVRMEHGVAYFDAGRDAEAITSLEDAVRLARILGAKRAEEVSLRMIEKAASLHQTSVPESAGGPDGPPTSQQAHPA
jgi:tetratricopeptide (TPR) repeat protein